MTERKAGRAAAGWFLGAIGVALAVFLCYRGAGRFVIPVVAAVLLGVWITRRLRAADRQH